MGCVSTRCDSSSGGVINCATVKFNAPAIRSSVGHEGDDNIVVSPAIFGKECVLMDDICTSGASIRDHVEELRRYDVKVIGVVCLGRTVDYTKDSRMIYRTALQERNLTTMVKILNLIC